MKQPRPEQPTLTLCDRAAEILKAAGFVLHYTSRRSEACYYRLPDRVPLLRVAAHSQKDAMLRGPSAPVVAKITFNGTCLSPPGHIRIADEKVENMIMTAIGRYFVKSGGVNPPRRP